VAVWQEYQASATLDPDKDYGVLVEAIHERLPTAVVTVSEDKMMTITVELSPIRFSDVQIYVRQAIEAAELRESVFVQNERAVLMEDGVPKYV